MTETTSVTDSATEQASLEQAATEPKPSYVKLAMRNMVRKGGKAIYHFTLTTIGVLGFFVLVAWLTH
ncbi:hypothetical protein Lepto7376_2577 [[Leptolyngbya] sp. PCC 7376]|uniref:DUF3285 domain-containing protein n=1 Tax=[Leptolyngbya] sp. PCC 7376 TaxID=111781 RepID=UPI00029ED719|nr:DUF3285 domain-containing protein [[Leptolyngbya] sp. PCC 7376]AFY38850.1 hypothetical protein Lepto7376_2577 [[Leptolyngbya] sp. PCC 7376]